MRPRIWGFCYYKLSTQLQMTLSDKQIEDFVLLQRNFFQKDYVNRLVSELSISEATAESLAQSAALADAYLSIKGREYKKLGYQNKFELCEAMLEYSSMYFLAGFYRVSGAESLYKKLRIYRSRRGVNAFEAAKWLLVYNQNNTSALKLTDQERAFIDRFLHNSPLAGYKKVYTALKAEFGSVSISRMGVKYQIRKVLETFEWKDSHKQKSR